MSHVIQVMFIKKHDELYHNDFSCCLVLVSLVIVVVIIINVGY